MLFALAALLGGGVLVGQALVRTVTAGAADLPTWRAIGADRGIAIRAMVAPSIVTAAVGAVTTVVVAIALSSRFPIGTAREYDLDLGTHADWLGARCGRGRARARGRRRSRHSTAWWRVTRREPAYEAAVDRGALGGAVGMVTGAGDRVAARGGAGTRATCGAGALGARRRDRRRARRRRVLHVPRRDRGRAHHAATRPGWCGTSSWPRATARSPPTCSTAIADDRDVAAALEAGWHRAVPVNGTSVPMFATSAVKGALPFVLIDGRRPQRADEIAFAPTTMKALHVSVGDRVRVGDSSSSDVGAGRREGAAPRHVTHRLRRERLDDEAGVRARHRHR